MKNFNHIIFGGGLLLAVLISNFCGFFRDCRELEKLRGGVLRLHILAESDDAHDQELKLKVRDKILECGVLSECGSLAQAELKTAENLRYIEDIAESVLRENGCELPVAAELANVTFDKRTYGCLTMPAGEYRALRVKIGSAQGKNWWCVMYPPLCLPAACDVEENKSAEKLFTPKELDILNKPQKYEVRFAVWDKIKSIYDEYIVKNDENF